MYKTVDEAMQSVMSAREYQTKVWPATTRENAGGRSYEKWLVLIDVYMTKLKAVYAETPKFLNDDGVTPNIEGRKRIEKYTAIVTNLALWAVQAAQSSE